MGFPVVPLVTSPYVRIINIIMDEVKKLEIQRVAHIYLI